MSPSVLTGMEPVFSLDRHALVTNLDAEEDNLKLQVWEP
jgi:hypothetical protein